MQKEEQIKQIIKEIAEKTTFHTEDVAISCDDTDGSLWCSIKTKEPYFFIGKEGETLSAFNHLARRIIDKATSNPETERSEQNIIIDVNDYQRKRIENLKTIAHMLAERAQFFKSSIETDPMSPFDRRIIHEFLANKPNIKTESTGLGEGRRVVIKYIAS